MKLYKNMKMKSRKVIKTKIVKFKKQFKNLRNKIKQNNCKIKENKIIRLLKNRKVFWMKI
jgi:hypothetical protein